MEWLQKGGNSTLHRELTKLYEYMKQQMAARSLHPSGLRSIEPLASSPLGANTLLPGAAFGLAPPIYTSVYEPWPGSAEACAPQACFPWPQGETAT